MRKLLFIQPLYLLIFILGLGSCCEVKYVRGYASLGMSAVSNESHEGQPSIPYGEVQFETGLCPFIFSSFIPSPSADVPCDCSSFENNNKAKSEKLRLIVGISYSHQGGKYKEENGLKGKVVTSYLNVPVLIRYQAPGGFYADAGLRPGLLLSARDKYLDQNDNYYDDASKFHLGLPIGIGYKFKNGIDIGIKATPGLTSIYPTDDPEDKPNKNFVAGITLGYSFALKKK